MSGDHVIDTCDNDHRFAALPGHPVREGRTRCPNCMAIGLDAARAELAALKDGGSIQIPKNAGQAEAMLRLGHAWLKKCNAPERLKQEEPVWRPIASTGRYEHLHHLPRNRSGAMTDYTIVPVEPTEEMIQSVAEPGDQYAESSALRLWENMLAAAPQVNISQEDLGYVIEFRVMKPEHPDYQRPYNQARFHDTRSTRKPVAEERPPPPMGHIAPSDSPIGPGGFQTRVLTELRTPAQVAGDSTWDPSATPITHGAIERLSLKPGDLLVWKANRRPSPDEIDQFHSAIPPGVTVIGMGDGELRRIALQWTDPTPPDESCHYDHVTAETPFGKISIEWKSWKSYPGYTVYAAWIESGYLASASSLDGAKRVAEEDFARRIAESVTPRS